MKAFKTIALLILTVIMFSACVSSSSSDEDYTPTSDPDNWVVERSAAEGQKTLNAVVGDSSTSVIEYAFGDGGAMATWENGSWSLGNLPKGYDYDYEDVSMLSPSAIWVVGTQGNIRFYDGTSWIEQESGTDKTLRAVSSLSKAVVVDAEELEDTFSSAKYAWAAGGEGTILHYNGTEWTAQASGTTENLYGIAMNDLTEDLTGTHGWAVGDNGAILYFDGTSWSPQSSGVTTNLRDVEIAYTSPDMTEVSIFAVGEGGLILHYDGTSWTQMESGSTANLNAVDAMPDGSAMAVGAEGTVLFYNAVSWSAHNSGVTVELQEIFMLEWGTYRGAVAVGADGSIVANRPTQSNTNYCKIIYISDDTYGGSGSWVQVTEAGSDFGNRDKWPYWATSDGRKIQGGWEPYLIRNGSGIRLKFCYGSGSHLFEKDLRFTVVYSYDYDPGRKVHAQMGQRYCFQLKGSSCSPGDGRTYVSNDPTGYSFSGRKFMATTASKVSETDSVEQLASQICSWMRISDTTSGWGKVVKTAIKAGLNKFFQSGPYFVYTNYETSVTSE
ncbi:MAG: hypothetical protein EOM25_09495 [Deltaproteobacteria bacterium]|nr:hypothetical protein [Deltaproteobacteria bacterium]